MNAQDFSPSVDHCLQSDYAHWQHLQPALLQNSWIFIHFLPPSGLFPAPAQVGNITDLKAFKINELAGVKLDREINVVAFQDGRQVPLPPGTGYVDENGRVCVGRFLWLHDMAPWQAGSSVTGARMGG
jgi:hypothetical protein